MEVFVAVRKTFVLGLVGAFVVGMVATAVAAEGTLVARAITAYYGNISVKVNGDVVKSDVEPFIVDGRTFVPLRAVGEALGMEVAWDQDNKQVLISGKVLAKDVGFTPLSAPGGRNHSANFSGLVQNSSNKVAQHVMVTCSATDKSGSMVVSGSNVVAEQLAPMSSQAFEFTITGTHGEPAVSAKCSAAAHF